VCTNKEISLNRLSVNFQTFCVFRKWKHAHRTSTQAVTQYKSVWHWCEYKKASVQNFRVTFGTSYVHMCTQRRNTHKHKRTFTYAYTRGEETWFWCIYREVRFCCAMLVGANKFGSPCRRWYLALLGHGHIKGRPEDIDLYGFGPEIGETATNHISVSVLPSLWFPRRFSPFPPVQLLSPFGQRSGFWITMFCFILGLFYSNGKRCFE